jgi:hypothetical protein
MELECKKCKQRKNQSEFYNGVECYSCWETEVDTKKVQELREKLSQYLEIDKGKIKENLTLKQLKEVRKVIKDNYVAGSDSAGSKVSEKGGKELIIALWVTGQKLGVQPFAYLKEIDLKIEKLKPAPEPVPELKTYTHDCPVCGKTFYCELEESDNSEKKANDILDKKVNKHIEKIHEKKKRELPDPDEEEVQDRPQKKASVNQKSEQTNRPSADSSKIPLPLIIIGSLLLIIGLIVLLGYFVGKKTKSSK